MNFRKVFETPEDSFQIAPLIDTVFLLLTFFIVTGALAAEEKETGVDLPRTSAAAARQRGRVDIVVNVTREGAIWVHGQQYSAEKLRRKLTDMQRSAGAAAVSVIIRADGKALHEDVLRVIDACAAARLRNVSFVSVHAGKPETE